MEKWFVIVAWNKRRQQFKMKVFLTCGQLMRHSLIKLFPLSSLLQILNDLNMVDVGFFGNFLCSCESISFDDALSWSLLTPNGQSLHFSPSRPSSPLRNFWNHHCAVCSLAVLDQMHCQFYELSLLLHEPFWTIRKSLEFFFCLTSFSKINIKYTSLMLLAKKHKVRNAH